MSISGIPLRMETAERDNYYEENNSKIKQISRSEEFYFGDSLMLFGAILHQKHVS